MRTRHDLGLQVQAAIANAQTAGDLPAFEIPPVVIERPRDAGYGDYATPSAMPLARLARLAPLKIAEAIAGHLDRPAYLSEVTVSPPGFINFRLAPGFLQQQVAEIVRRGEAYGAFDLGQGRRVQVEFVSANPTGPLTIGRGRGGVMGDTLARAFAAAGYDVTREYYFNNAGRQIEMLGESLKIRYQQLLGQPAVLGEDHYQGDYLYWIAAVLVSQYGDTLQESPAMEFARIAEKSIFTSIRTTLQRLNIRFDVYYNENDLYTTGRVWEALEALNERGYAYQQDGAHWFRSSAFGDEKDRVLIKSSGEPTYRMADIAYHWHKAERGFDRVVDIFGADHHATAPTVLMGVKALGYDPDFVHVLIHQFVTLIRDGEQVRMSTRRGHYVTLDELMDEVGADAVRYFMLSRSGNSTIDFDMDLAVEQSDKNPVYYIQNAHVRCAGIFRKWTEAGLPPNADEAADLSLLTHESELAFLRKALELPEVLELMVTQYEPHHIAFYAYELASIFHPTYETCRVLHSEVPEPLRLARLRFYRAAKQLFGRVLDLMGMSALETM
ncbi:MAG: arginine--tRNA ligase [Chloroflexi bacterium]|nr:arginine--tRNA ligase [Chloroflexota bacterium]MCI0578746.1 arginine--tRNA ligase [Chloroflexota bacterium]MCI0643969.1 arginine--tRNA ligase [Chloroflexota bacterium]MCI0732032.1 arginine--tRNA ligase [Chloroflexota bacterium]